MSSLIKLYKSCYVVFYSIGLLLLISSCASQIRINKTPIEKHLQSANFKSQMTGLVVYNPISKDTLVNFNGAQFFIPASNTKIFTLFTALSILPEKMPLVSAIEISKDSLVISAMGYPTSLHPFFKDSSLINFLKPYTHIGLHTKKLIDHPYGPGWAWEDYDSYYAPERSAFPLYGNVLTLIKNDSVEEISPNIFKNNLKPKDNTNSFNRAAVKNVFYVPKKPFSIEIPFKTSDSLTMVLLKNSTQKQLFLSPIFNTNKSKIIYGIPRDSVLKRMMKVSDNFLAEQLLINASAYISDSLSIIPAQQKMLKGPLKNLKQAPRWVDGSGLSRYNLMSPISFVQVLEALYKMKGLEYLKTFFPWGGENGTLENWFKGAPSPYIFAKTGSLGNTYCLSGYLVSKKGKILIFSYMNNHFIKPSSQLKREMQTVLEAIRDQN